MDSGMAEKVVVGEERLRLLESRLSAPPNSLPASESIPPPVLHSARAGGASSPASNQNSSPVAHRHQHATAAVGEFEPVEEIEEFPESQGSDGPSSHHRDFFRDHAGASQVQAQVVSVALKPKRKFQRCEDEKILQGVEKFGDQAWSEVAAWANLERTAEQIRNRYKRIRAKDGGGVPASPQSAKSFARRPSEASNAPSLPAPPVVSSSPIVIKDEDNTPPPASPVIPPVNGVAGGMSTRKRVRASNSLEAYNFKNKKLKSSMVDIAVQTVGAASAEDLRRWSHQEATLRSKQDDLRAQEEKLGGQRKELDEREQALKKFERDLKELHRLQACIASYQQEIKNEKERVAARDKRVQEELVRLLKAQGKVERAQRREHNIRQSIRLGRVLHQRTGATIAEVWEDGEAFQELLQEQSQVADGKEHLEAERKQLSKRKLEEKKESEKREGDKGDDAGAPLSDTQLEDERLKLRAAELRKTEASLAERRQQLEREKGLFIKELKRVHDEDNSQFNTFPVLSARYVLLHLLGKGGFSEVYQAYDTEELRYVACKIHQLNSHWSDQKKENYLRHATREYNIQRAISHPRFVRLFDVFKIDHKSFCTVLELCEGHDLDFHLKMHKTLGEKEVRSIIGQVFSGLRYLNEQKQRVIHYDLKPANILYHNNEVKITDFGLSKLLGDNEQDVELTSQGAGTYWYLPPECFVTSQIPTISSKVDVWSVGVIMFQLLFGKRPFGHELSQHAIFSQKTMLHATQVSFPTKPPISDEAKDFIARCLTFDQQLRPDVLDMLDHSFFKPKK